MKILLIGKDGQLGTELHKEAESLDTEIVSFGRNELDISDFSSVSRAIKKYKPSVVINAAAFHVVPECEIHPEQAFLINAIAPKNAAVACSENNAQFVTYSTDYVFDGRKGLPYKEDDKPNPLQVYGVSKLAGEYLSLQYSHFCLIIRACGLYGGTRGSRSKKGNFVLTILNQTKSAKKLEVSSEQIVNPTYAKDLARATFSLLDKKPESGIYHLASEGYCSWADFAKEIVRLAKRKTQIIPVDRGGIAGSLRRPLFSALQNTRAWKYRVRLPYWMDSLEAYLSELHQ